MKPAANRECLEDEQVERARGNLVTIDVSI
jgi:hypothetical protein